MPLKGSWTKIEDSIRDIEQSLAETERNTRAAIRNLQITFVIIVVLIVVELLTVGAILVWLLS